MGFGTNLKRLLTARGKTVVWLAEESGIPSTTLYSIIKRDNQPKFDTVERIANAIGVNVSLLLQGAPKLYSYSKEIESTIDFLNNGKYYVVPLLVETGDNFTFAPIGADFCVDSETIFLDSKELSILVNTINKLSEEVIGSFIATKKELLNKDIIIDSDVIRKKERLGTREIAGRQYSKKNDMINNKPNNNDLD